MSEPYKKALVKNARFLAAHLREGIDLDHTDLKIIRTIEAQFEHIENSNKRVKNYLVVACELLRNGMITDALHKLAKLYQELKDE